MITVLDQSTETFINQLLVVRPLYTFPPKRESPLPETFKLRLLQLFSLKGHLRAGLGRVESPGHPFHGLCANFGDVTTATSNKTANFTDKPAYCFSVSLSDQEPTLYPIGAPWMPMEETRYSGLAQIVAEGFSFPMLRHRCLPAALRAQVAKIPSAIDGMTRYFPCDVLLKNGERVDRVCFVPELPYLLSWGRWPQEGANNWISLVDVASVEESRFRLPLQFAQTLYDAGESGMGYLLFTVVFDDGSQAAYCLGNGSIDFLDYPTNKGPRNVVNVAPHAGRSDPNLRHGADYRWCLYSEAL